MSAAARDIDYILEHFVGPGGRWQWTTLFYLFPLVSFSFQGLFMQVFTAYVPPHRCRVPLCDIGNVSSVHVDEPAFVDFAIPRTLKTQGFLTDGEAFDSCTMYTPVDPEGECSADNFDDNVVNETECTEFVYDTSFYLETFATKTNLVCQRDDKRRFLGTAMMLGLLMGSLMGGPLSDFFGRKKTMYLSNAWMGLAILAGCFVSDFVLYAVLRFFTCTFVAVTWVSHFPASVELFGTRFRGATNCVMDLFLPLAMLTLALQVYLIRSWTILHVVIGTLTLAVCATWWVVPESIRWQVQNGHKDKALAQLLTVASTNGKTLTPEQVDQITKILDAVELESETDRKKKKTTTEKLSAKHLTPLDMLRKSYWTVTMALCLCWVTVNVSNYVFALNATKLSGDIFLNFTLVALCEFPGAAMLFLSLKTGGHKGNLAFYLATAGLSCLALALIPKRYAWAVLVIFLVGKCFIGAAFQMLWFTTSESYPTNVRSQALGTLSTIARIFGLVCPYITKLSDVWPPLPMLTLGLAFVVAAGLSLCFLPETSHKSLPQTLADVMRWRKKEKAEVEPEAEAGPGPGPGPTPRRRPGAETLCILCLLI